MLTPDILLEAAFKIRLKKSTIRRLKRRVAVELESGAISVGENSVVVGNGDGRGGDEKDEKEKDRDKEKEKEKKSSRKRNEDRVKVDGVEFRLLGE